MVVNCGGRSSEVAWKEVAAARRNSIARIEFFLGCLVHKIRVLFVKVQNGWFSRGHHLNFTFLKFTQTVGFTNSPPFRRLFIFLQS
jgi:hypothetical protein